MPNLFLLVQVKNHLIRRWYLELNYDIISLTHIFGRIKMDIQREKNLSANTTMMPVILSGKRKWHPLKQSRCKLSIDQS